jgi:hypothetical protein
MKTVMQRNVIQYETKINPLVSNKVTIGKPIDNHKITVRKQIGNHKITIRKQIDDNMVTVREQKSNNKITRIHQNMQGGTLTYEDALLEVARLVGLQKNVLFYVVQRCIVKGDLLSGPITMDMMKASTEANGCCIKTSINRLIHRGGFGKRIG